MVLAINPRTFKAEVGVSLWKPGQSGIHKETLSQTTTKQKQNNNKKIVLNWAIRQSVFKLSAPEGCLEPVTSSLHTWFYVVLGFEHSRNSWLSMVDQQQPSNWAISPAPGVIYCFLKIRSTMNMIYVYVYMSMHNIHIHLWGWLSSKALSRVFAVVRQLHCNIFPAFLLNSQAISACWLLHPGLSNSSLRWKSRSCLCSWWMSRMQYRFTDFWWSLILCS